MNLVLNAIRESGISAAMSRPAEADKLPDRGGAYLLVMRLEIGFRIDLPRFRDANIHPGWLVYSGSSNGPGGMRGRVNRHFRQKSRPPQKPHWHVDRLTARSADIAAVPIAGGDECDLIHGMLKHPAFEVAITGFGNSDCQLCESHLLRYRGL